MDVQGWAGLTAPYRAALQLSVFLVCELKMGVSAILRSDVVSAGGTGVKPCGNSLYCCYGFTDCDCDNSTQVFSLDPVRIVTSLALATSATGIATINQASYTTATASSSLVLSSSVTQATATPSSSSGTTSNVAIGLGVGLGVGIPLSLFALGVLWLLKRWYGQTRTAGSGTAVGQSTGGRVGSQSYGYPGMAVKAELENQPKVELPGNRGVELQSGSIIPWELAGQSNR